MRVGLPVGPGHGEEDPSLFATSIVGLALSASDDPLARSIADRAARYLRGQMEPPGVWRHWLSEHPQYDALPPDADDTACVSCVLRRHGIDFPDNSSLLLANRDRRGRFYTWLVPRRSHPAAALAIWRPALRRGRHPVLAQLFWRRTSAAPYDVDAVVNAGVLLYLGDGAHARPVVSYLLEVLARREMAHCDKWYRSPFLFYAAVSRCAEAGVSGLEEAGMTIAARIAAATSKDGQIGAGPVDTALGLTALTIWNVESRTCARAARYLVTSQSSDGSWPAEPVYFGGPPEDPQVPSWGSEELTTALCVEALSRNNGSMRGR